MVGPQHPHEAADTALEILAHRRRRYALQCLREHETPMSLAELTAEVVDREYDASRTELSDETVERVRLSLYHTHVPKLVDAEHVRYGRERDSIALRGSPVEFEHLRGFLERDVPVSG